MYQSSQERRRVFQTWSKWLVNNTSVAGMVQRESKYCCLKQIVEEKVSEWSIKGEVPTVAKAQAKQWNFGEMTNVNLGSRKCKIQHFCSQF